MPEISIRTDEFLPARNASRSLGKAIERLRSGVADKYVIVNRNQVQAVLLSVDRYAELMNTATGARPSTRHPA
jgi:PHD/YefM family antitoxin component YafN of YafNO toxin-antitoxin module